MDLDGDGIATSRDACPGTPSGTEVNAQGCTDFARAVDPDSPPPARRGTLLADRSIATPDGFTRFYDVYLPPELPAGAPLVIALHGGTQGKSAFTGGDLRNAQNQWPLLADRDQFLLLIPNGVDASTCTTDNGDGKTWNDCRSGDSRSACGQDDTGLIDLLIDRMADEFAIDLKRVYAVGASNGGMMAFRLARELGGRIAAIAPALANMPAPSECSGPTHPVAVAMFSATDDPLMPFDGGCVAANCGQTGSVISAAASRDFWLAHNGASAVPAFTIDWPNIATSDGPSDRGSTVTGFRHTGGRAGTEVLFTRIDGGGHTLPSIRYLRRDSTAPIIGHQNHDIETPQLQWDFLKRFRRR